MSRRTTFLKDHPGFKRMYNEGDARISIPQHLRAFCGEVIKDIVGIPMGTYCDPLVADILLCSYKAEFIQNLLSAKKTIKHLSSTSHTDTSMTYCPFKI